METLHGFDCYVAEPPTGKAVEGVIVYFPDAFGFDLVNNKIVADHYASMGNFRVVFPDFMLGLFSLSLNAFSHFAWEKHVQRETELIWHR
jgi:hypothetical protein